ncbi:MULTISPECIES: protein YgfX [unclassified Symbiopectobacterium]|uniref:protein YgfX n=1 Tax=unclassified Symbiopectobacterium TaxID=2794573 RepID=UPI002227692F|nr:MULTISPECIES: protein YgfX [unclassified Symbiopectobacterium]MCW2475235.1 protein YgfX [Candidatus Symbiopectobacterium sp. NZEC151]MCW2486586.1 protein YgfX [Candidatus Symbiopectobacterium sp. NZEC127]
MALWRCDLRVSWRMQVFSLLVHGLLLLLILLAPWPDGYAVLWLSLMTLVVFGFIRSQRNIKARHGEIVLQDKASIEWQQHRWRIIRRPWMLKNGILLSLRRSDGKRRQRLWLASDNMDKQEWRHLRQLLLESNAWAGENPDVH